MDPIHNQPLPYSKWDVDLYALQREQRHKIQVQVDVNLPKPFEAIIESKKAKKSEKTQKEKGKESKNKKEKKGG